MAKNRKKKKIQHKELYSIKCFCKACKKAETKCQRTKRMFTTFPLKRKQLISSINCLVFCRL